MPHRGEDFIMMFLTAYHFGRFSDFMETLVDSVSKKITCSLGLFTRTRIVVAGRV
jgi:hypothetical protein